MNSLQALGALKLFESNIIEFKNVIEIVSLCTKKKSVVRLVIPKNKLKTVKHVLTKYFNEYRHSLAPYALVDVFFGSATANDGTVDRFQDRVAIDKYPEGDRVIFLGTKSGVEEAVELESGECDNLEASSIYGYPSCCALAYDKIEKSGSWIEACLSNVTGTVHLPAIANRFSTLISPELGVHLDYFPCLIDCKETLSINETNKQCLALSPLADFIQPVNEHLNATIIWWKSCMWYLKGKPIHDTQIFSNPLKPVIFPASDASHTTIEGVACQEKKIKILVDGKWIADDDKNPPRIISFEESMTNG